MDTQVVSDHLKDLLNDCEVKAAVFTTYMFDPEFFELEVIPLLLPGNTAFSSDARVKQFQVREALRESRLDLEVFYDLPIFRREGSSSPSMEYLFHGVHRGNNAFHAKVAMILVHDKKHDRDCLLVGAGSNNLTRAGWWDNIECVHWEAVWENEAPRVFFNQLEEDVTWLQSERYLEPFRSNSALDKIGAFLANCKTWTQAEKIAYYGLSDIGRRGGFPAFIGKQARNLLNYNNWTLEIISPFFAENPENTEHEFFYKLGVKEIHLLLPMDQEGNALCQLEYFNHINEQQNIHWANWADHTATSLHLKGQYFRRLHAKVYHFYNKVQSWAFVGSINFTHKAMWDNIEAGYFTKLESSGPLLTRIKRPDSIEHFVKPIELTPGAMGELEDVNLPRIYLAYDWPEQRLTGVTELHRGYTINILTPEGNAAVNDWAITGTSRDYGGDVDALEKLLRNGSLVKVAGFNTRSGDPFITHTVMLMQTGWSHKPQSLPDLTPAQILAIYAEMSPEQRVQGITRGFVELLVLEGSAGDLMVPTDDFIVEQFFSEYAEIFHAFRRLKKRLAEAITAGNEPMVDYYLTGTGMDSLPTLLDCATRESSTVSPVTSYLILLCVKEIYQQPDFAKYKLVKRQLSQVHKQIKAFKSPDMIKLVDYSDDKRKEFFNWFENQFFKTYRVIDTSNDEN